MTTSGIDYFSRLITKLHVLGGPQTQNGSASAQAFASLAAALTRLPPGSGQRIAYNSVMDHAATLNLGRSIEDIERDHAEDYRLNFPESQDAGPFLENLIADIDGLIDDAELSADDDAAGRAREETDVATARANEIARGIACKRAEDGAREAAEQAYRLAYQWAYEDIFEEAYHQALSQLIDAVEA